MGRRDKISWAAILLVPLASVALAQTPRNGEHWAATWGTAQQLVRGTGLPGGGRGARSQKAAAPASPRPGPQRRFGIPPVLEGLNNQTVRMIAKVSLGGSSVRIRLSNALNGTSITIGAAHIAIRDKDSGIVAGTDRALRFGGKPAATMYAGQMLVSDAVGLQVPALAEVAVSLYVPGETGIPTTHLFGLHPTYVSKAGDFTGSPAIEEPEATTESYYWLAGIDVLAPADTGTVVTFGDSITDGDQSTPGTNGMWPAILAARLQANRATRNIGVVNAGISGNRILGDNGGGLVRLMHDALSQPGVRWITLLEGINDITGARPRPGMPDFSADDLIAAYKQVIETAHLYGVKAIGCTLTPFGGSNVYNEEREAIRDAANRWIRTSGAFDAVIDFDAATRDASDPKRYRPEVDSPDMLHPSNAGYKMMGEAIDLSIFRR